MIKIGYLISYDYELLFNSIPTVYDEADEIFLALDKNRNTWAGNKFSISDSFFERVKKIDTHKKIRFFEEDFFIPTLSPMENEIRERNLLLKEMGKGWLIQLDSDEYLYNFKQLATFLRKKKYLVFFRKIFPVTLSGYWLILFKKSKEGFFYISNKTAFNFITNYPKYTGARKNSKFVNINVGSIAYHQAYARGEDEIHQKINNWGHKDDFDTDKFFNFWKTISIENYKSIKDFHPQVPNLWTSLSYTKADSVEELIKNSELQEEVYFHRVTGRKIAAENFRIFYNRRIKRIKKRMINVLRIL